MGMEERSKKWSETGDALRNEALVVIAEELEKMRLLKEYELGVLVGEDEGRYIAVGRPQWIDTSAEGQGEIIWREDKGDAGTRKGNEA